MKFKRWGVTLLAGAAAGVTACGTTAVSQHPAAQATKVIIKTVTVPAKPAATSVNPSPSPVQAAPSPSPVQAAPAPSPQPVQDDPWAIVSEYYGDVTSGDYADAWNLLGPEMQARSGSYDNYVAGYSGTGNQDVYEVSESPPDVTYYLFSVNPDGTTQYYEGTATVYDGKIQTTSVSQLAGNPRA